MGIQFDECVKRGGDIKTKQLPGNKFMRTCTIDGKTFSGKIQTKKNKLGPKKAKKAK